MPRTSLFDLVVTLAAVALVALVTWSILSTPAKADAYVKVFGGAAFLNDFNGHGNHVGFNTTFDTGYVAGAAIGSEIDAVPGLRVELEASFRQAQLQGTLFYCGDPSVMGGSSGTFAALVNVVYSVDAGGGFHPYAFVGAGGASRRIELQPTPDNWKNTSDEHGFAFQLGTGVEYQFADGVKLGIGYTYFQGPQDDGEARFGKKSAAFQADGDSNEITASLRVDL